ncbi:MAG: DUF1805 domain-containing protein [Candidatus Hodarchaeaceae archaeon]|nr:DUF1805 domain-containing protein [Candidatus Hodarchaeaceae archaeon]
MIEKRNVKIDGKEAFGLKVELPGAPMLLLVAPRGYVMCGYLNIETAERLGQVAAVVTGVKSFEDVLGAEVARVTAQARRLGVKEGMLGREALRLMF